MTVIEEWNAIQSLESDEINFDISTIDETRVHIGSLDMDSYRPTDREIEMERDMNGEAGLAVTEFGTGYNENEADWELSAACRAVEGSANLFFSEELADIVAAKRICADCPVIAPCLEGALSRSEPCGVWGGQLFLNGRILANKRRRGRPPKHPKPEDQLPVVPVPVHLQKLIA